MSERYYYKNPSGGVIIPVADGDFFTDLMGADYRLFEQSSIEFYSDAEGTLKVTPTAGTVTVSGSPDDSSYFTIDNGTFNAADAYLASRTRPNAQLLMIKSKLSLAGVAGANYFKAFTWRY
jgi:hypothetical protein